MPYETTKALKVLGALGFDGMGVPFGVSLSNQLAEMLRDMTGELGLAEMGVVTPWATRQSDIQWTEISKPDTNIATFQIDDQKIKLAQDTVLFGQRLPFLTVLTGRIQTTTELQDILDGSMYELFETQAVYRQDDPDPVPNILFLHWLRVLPEDQIPLRVKPMGDVAKEMSGQLLFSQQVSVESSTLRGAPVMTFAQAFGSQEPDPLGPAPVITTQPTTTTQPITTTQPAPTQSATQAGSLVLPIVVGVVSAVTTALFMKRWVK
jgi:hypothetical protein